MRHPKVVVLLLMSLLFASEFARGEWKQDGTWLRTRQDDELIALATANGDTKIGVVYLTKDPALRIDWLLGKIGAWSGVADHVDRKVGYVRAMIPTQLAHTALKMPAGVAARIDFDGSFHLDSSSYVEPEPTIDVDRTRSEINSATTRNFLHSPSLILRDLHADEWTRQHPTFDGRGVVIADVEGFTDPMIPELSGALSLDGKPVRKIATVHLAVDPGDSGGQPDVSRQWVNMDVHVSGTDHVTINEISYHLPHPGEFRFGIFDLAGVTQTGSHISPKVFGATISDGRFAVLWEESSGLVWVDIKHSHDFRVVHPMRDFNISGDWSYFGSLHSAQYPLLRPAVSFVVLENRTKERVAIVLGMDAHAAGVTTSAAGRRIGPDDPVSGVAPAAQVSSFEYSGSKLHSQAEALIAAFEDPKSDIVLYEYSSAANTDYDRGGFMSELGERLVDQFDKPLIVPGENAAILASIADAGLGRDVLAVGGSQSAASYLRYEGFMPSASINKLWNGAADGPGPGGQLKPDVLAPAGYVTGAVRFYWDADQHRKAGLYTLPPGYRRFGGTSQAAPSAAGAAALLLSAAKQTGLRVHAIDLANALRFGASLAPNLAVHDQGNGTIDVARSWQILATRAKSTPASGAEVGQPCGGSVHTSWSWFQETARAESGILETVGWHPDDRAVRTLSFCFQQQPQEYKVSLLLNDGSFRIAGARASTSSVNVAVEIHPIKPGLHTAIVQLVDAHDTVIGRGMVSIGAAAPLDEAHKYRMEQKIQVPRPGYTATLVDVPAGTDALLVHADRQMVFGMVIQDPDGRYYLYHSPPWRPYYPGYDVSHHSATIPHPRTGTWSILLIDTHDVTANARDLLPVTPSPVDVDVEAVRVQRTDGTKLHNVFADVPIRLAGTMQSLIATSGELTSAAPVVIPVQLKEDTDALMIDLSGSASSTDAYFFRCQEKSCTPVDSVLGDGADKRLTIPHLRAGNYRLVIQDYDLGAVESAQKHYRVSVFPYIRSAPSTSPLTGDDNGSAYEANCDAGDRAITNGPKCGLFIKTNDPSD